MSTEERLSRLPALVVERERLLCYSQDKAGVWNISQKVGGSGAWRAQVMVEDMHRGAATTWRFLLFMDYCSVHRRSKSLSHWSDTCS